MSEDSQSSSDERSLSCSSESEDDGLPERHPEVAIPEYERQRIQRITENRTKLDSLGLHNLAGSLFATTPKAKAPRSKKRKEDDDEYTPEVEEYERSSSSEESDGQDLNKSTTSLMAAKSKKNQVFKSCIESDYVEDDNALQQAIALSLSSLVDCGECSVECNADADVKMKKVPSQETPGLRRKLIKRKNVSRLKMTEDEMMAYFCSFDEVRKGSITLLDLKRIALSHDFIWSEKELADMIDCFDNDGDGKLTLENFRTVVAKCNLL